MGVWLVGVDTGGTFTDLIAVERGSGRLLRAKVPSAPQDPSVAVSNALQVVFEAGVPPGDIGMVVHGTTVATNALLEGDGVSTGLMITRGFRAVYEARGWSQPSGADLLDVFYQKPPLLAPQYLTEEVVERLDYRGEVVTPLDEDRLRASVRRLVERDAESIAVCLLFSFVNPAHEDRVAEIIAEEAPGRRVSLSSRILPVIREYPRLSTTVIDAYVGPKIETYLVRLDQRLNEAQVTTPQKFLMQSNGGLMRLTMGARHPNQTLLSGPAAGVIAAADLARKVEQSHVVTFDMGGTSSDISVILDGELLELSQGQIAGQDIGTPMLRVRTLGAGGGTVAEIGKDGLLKVGPRSSGSQPGPACYGRGGVEPTVTDANLLLGALDAETLLAGKLRLDVDASRAAMERVGAALGLGAVETAAGILRIVNTHMAVDLRLALQEQGQDPRKFALVGFGGAGPLHAAALARSAGIPKIVIPPYPGLNCALGMLQTSVRHSYLRSEIGILSRMPAERIDAVFGALAERALSEAEEEGFERREARLTRLLDMRYPQQGYTLSVPCPEDFRDADRPVVKAAFDDLHLRVYGQNAPQEEAEIVTFRLRSEIETPRLELPAIERGDGDPKRAHLRRRPLYDLETGRFNDADVYQREKLRAGDRIVGPAIIDQFDATTLVLGGQKAVVDSIGCLVITEAQA